MKISKKSRLKKVKLFLIYNITEQTSNYNTFLNKGVCL